MHHLNWHEIQKLIEGALIFAWEGWLGQTSKVKASSTYELVKFGFNFIGSKFKKGDSQNGPKI